MAVIATVSMAVDPRNKRANRDKMVEYIEQAAAQNVDLLAFPEECLTGLGTAPLQQFKGEDREYLIDVAELVPEGDSVQFFAELAKKHDMYIVFGMVEKNPERFDVIHNVAVMVGPDGYMGKYRKVHLPLCERLFHQPGFGDYPVFDTRIGKVGLEICYDKCFPEVARELALKGAQIIVGPVCWPNLTHTLDDPDHKVYTTFSHARAMENMVFFVDANYCGEFLGGHSQIVGPNPGQVCATTGFDEGMAVAEVDVEKEILHARIYSMGGSDLLRDRKPGTYENLTKFSPFQLNHGGRVCEEISRGGDE